MSIINCGGNVEGGGLPDPTSASAGDVLTLDSNKDAVWQAPSGGNIDCMTAHRYTTWGALATDLKRLSGGKTYYGSIAIIKCLSAVIPTLFMYNPNPSPDYILLYSLPFITASGSTISSFSWVEPIQVDITAGGGSKYPIIHDAGSTTSTELKIDSLVVYYNDNDIYHS